MLNYKKMPKVELHLHLDGSVRPETAAKLLGIDITEARKNMIADDKCLDLNDYLTKFFIPGEVMQTKKNLELISEELAADLEEDGVIYAEIRFAPLKHVFKGLSLDEVVESVLKGLAKKSLKTNLILCMMRGDKEEDNIKVVDLAERFLNRGVVALDLAGAESIYKTIDYKNLFVYAKGKNIPFTIHAGEADGKDSMKAAIDFGAKRLGHGVNAIFHKEILEEIRQKDILLEICPTSNVQTNVIKDIKYHPVRKLYDANILVSINTDNNTVSNVTLTTEYEKLAQKLNFTYKDFVKMNKDAIRHAFISEDEKEQLLQKYDEKLNQLS